jgi:hypothetical protein
MRKRIAANARALIVTLLTGLLMPAGARAQAQAPAAAPVQTDAQPAAPGQPDDALVQETPAVSPGAAAFDVMVLRPLGFVVIPVGVALFVPAALTTAPNGLDSVQAALELFVTNPTNYVFKRPLGEF